MVIGHGPIERLVRLWLPVGFFLVLALFPFYWMAITSLKSNQELYSRKVMPLIVHNPTLKHYVDLITETNFLEWTWNTFVVAVLSTAISFGYITGPSAHSTDHGAGRATTPRMASKAACGSSPGRSRRS